MPIGDNDLDDLDRLVSELNLAGPPASSVRARRDEPAADGGPLESWLAGVREAEGSDLLLVAGAPPTIRAGGKLLPASGGILDGDDVEAAVLPFVPARLQERYRDGQAVDLAFKLPGRGRFRMNLHRERGRAAAAIRALPMQVPRIPDLHFTHDIAMLSALPRGLVLIGGPTGSGKTTTLAALVAEINGRDAR